MTINSRSIVAPVIPHLEPFLRFPNLPPDAPGNEFRRFYTNPVTLDRIPLSGGESFHRTIECAVISALAANVWTQKDYMNIFTLVAFSAVTDCTVRYLLNKIPFSNTAMTENIGTKTLGTSLAVSLFLANADTVWRFFGDVPDKGVASTALVMRNIYLAIKMVGVVDEIRQVKFIRVIQAQLSETASEFDPEVVAVEYSFYDVNGQCRIVAQTIKNSNSS